MKKLLAIAVAAAITVPMAASADTKVYGKAHVAIQDTNAANSKWDVVSKGSRIGFKGSNALDNGLSATHKFEMGVDIADKPGGLSDRDAWVGLKGGFGEVRIGRHTVPSAIVDNAADFMTNSAGSQGLLGLGRVPNAVAYIGGMGNVGYAIARTIGSEKNTTDSATDLMVNYSAGPLYAGVGVLAAKDHKAAAKIALAYKGANYGVGVVAGKQPIAKAATGNAESFVTLSGKYGFGKAYVAAEFDKETESKNTAVVLELGYGLGKGTKTYVDYTQEKDDAANITKKTARLGLVHSF